MKRHLSWLKMKSFAAKTKQMEHVLPLIVARARRAVCLKGLKQTDIAMDAGCSDHAVNRFLAGRLPAGSARAKAICRAIKAAPSQSHKADDLACALRMSPWSAHPTVKADGGAANMRLTGFVKRTVSMQGQWPEELIEARHTYVLKGLDTQQLAHLAAMDRSTVWGCLNGRGTATDIATVIHIVRIARPGSGRFTLVDLEPEVMAIRKAIILNGLTPSEVAQAIGCHEVTLRKLISGITTTDCPTFAAARDYLAALSLSRTGKTHFRNTRPAR